MKPRNQQPIYPLPAMTPRINRVVRTWEELRGICISVSRSFWKSQSPRVMALKGFSRTRNDGGRVSDDFAQAIFERLWASLRNADGSIKPTDRGFVKKQAQQVAIKLVRIREKDSVSDSTDAQGKRQRLIPQEVSLDAPADRPAEPGEVGTDGLSNDDDGILSNHEKIADRRASNPYTQAEITEANLVNRTGRNLAGVKIAEPLGDAACDALEARQAGYERKDIAEKQHVSVRAISERTRKAREAFKALFHKSSVGQ